jgi:ornithine cyclodeaminase
VTGADSFVALMPAYYPQSRILGAKLVSIVPGNATRGLHTHLATVSLLDPATGELLAVMDGRYITEVRTAAASAVSVRRLARAGSRVLAILGSGVQARSHLEVLAHAFAFDEVRAWSPNAGRLAQFVDEAARPVRASASAPEAVRGADVVVVATNPTTPVIENDWVSDGAHIVAIGACRPWQREVDPRLVARSRLFVDSRPAALAESGDILLPIQEGLVGPEHIQAELGEVVAGTRPGRCSDSDVTLFKSLGQAIEDLVAADLVYRRALERNLGTQLS